MPRFGNALLGSNLESSLCSVAKKEKGKNEKRAVFPDGRVDLFRWQLIEGCRMVVSFMPQNLGEDPPLWEKCVWVMIAQSNGVDEPRVPQNRCCPLATARQQDAGDR